MKYKILIDYRTEGYHFQDEEFDSVDAAVKHALSLGSSAPFLIVHIVDWEAQVKTS